MIIMSFMSGPYFLEIEFHLSEIILQTIHEEDQEIDHFAALLEMLDNKKDKFCAQILFFDNQIDHLIDNM